MAYTKTIWDNDVTAVDETNMNKIEDGLFNQDARITGVESGWTVAPGTWTYASATTINVPAGAASIYQVGDKIKLTQNTAKYFYITAVADTLLTVTGGSDYTVASATITSPYYSHQENPLGFPVGGFNYTPTISGTANAGTFIRTKFCITNGWCFYRGQMNYANAYGSGNVLISKPIALNTGTPMNDDYHIIGFATFYNNGAGVVKCFTTISGGGIFFPAITGTVQPDNVTWTSGDAIYWQCNYPIA